MSAMKDALREALMKRKQKGMEAPEDLMAMGMEDEQVEDAEGKEAGLAPTVKDKASPKVEIEIETEEKPEEEPMIPLSALKDLLGYEPSQDEIDMLMSAPPKSLTERASQAIVMKNKRG